MPKKINIASLSAEDVSAITAALPLVLQFSADTEEQDMLNEMAVESAWNKLVNRDEHFSMNEMRVIYIAVGLAKEHLSGHLPLDLAPDEVAELRRHFFTYNRLYSVFDPLFS